MANKIDTLMADALELKMRDEDGRKRDYIVGEFLFGNREEADIVHLAETLRPIVRRYQ